jgi:hypothetical protein
MYKNIHNAHVVYLLMGWNLMLHYTTYTTGIGPRTTFISTTRTVYGIMASQEKENLLNELDVSTSTISNSYSLSTVTSEMGESLWHSGSLKNKRSKDIIWEMGESPPIGTYDVLDSDPRTNWNVKSFNRKPALRRPKQRLSKKEREERMERFWHGGGLKNKKTSQIKFDGNNPGAGTYEVLEQDPRNNWNIKTFNVYRQS